MKIIKSKAFRLAVFFSIMIAAAVILFSMIFVFVIKSNIRNNQNQELNSSCDLIKNAISQNSTSSLSELSYYISYVVYQNQNEEIQTKTIFTNDPFMIILKKTNGKSKIYYDEDFYTDGALNILYLTNDFSFNNEFYTIQVSLSLDLDWGEKLLNGIFYAVMMLIFPLLILSFAISFTITKGIMNPVSKIAKTARNLSLQNLCENPLPLSGSNDEFDELSKTFNELFKKIDSDFKREKQFTSDVSHELKTPLTVISGHVNLIKRWGKEDPVQLEKSLERINGEVLSMQTIIENLLKLSRLDAKKLSPNLQNVNVQELFERLKDDTLAWASDVKFECKNLNYEIFCDKEMLYEIFTVLISNSVKFGGENVKITISEEIQKEISGEEKIILIVSDNGPGILEDALPHVLERFYRADEAHNRKNGGAGLGLSIVKSICDVHDAKVEVKSDGKSGTDVLIKFSKNY